MDSFFVIYKDYILKSVPKNQVYIMQCYLDFIILGIKAATNPKISTQTKLKKFDLLYRQIFKSCAIKNNLITKLQQNFIKENISLSLISDMINALKQLALQEQPDGKTQIYIMQLFINPLARMIMVLNNLNMSIYMPFISLLMGGGVISLFQTGKVSDRRFYTSKLNGFIKDGQILPMLIKNKCFKFKICFFVMMINSYAQKIKRKEQLKLTIIDSSKILMYACAKWLFTRVKTLNLKGI